MTKSSVYIVFGCAGSQIYREKQNCLSYREASKMATKLNRENADHLGISYREYYRNEVILSREGVYVSGKTGLDGVRV